MLGIRARRQRVLGFKIKHLGDGIFVMITVELNNGLGNGQHLLVRPNSLECVYGKNYKPAVILGIAFGVVNSIYAWGERVVGSLTQNKLNARDGASPCPDPFAPFPCEVEVP